VVKVSQGKQKLVTAIQSQVQAKFIYHFCLPLKPSLTCARAK